MGLLTPKVLYIPQGSVQKIIAQLQKQNPEISHLDTLLIRFFGQPQHGWIDLESTRMNHGDFLHRLCTSKAAMQSMTLIPGETTAVFFLQLADRFKLDSDRLQTAFDQQSPFAEGALAPDTYQLPVGLSEEGVVALLLKYSDRAMQDWSQKVFGSYNEVKWHRYLTIASIVQKEAADADEMAAVSSVIYNRLAKGMKLQMDGTLNYGIYSHRKITAARIRSDDTAYNTYRQTGLPPEPVCNVSFDAIRAAIFPAKTPYLYFTKGANGKHRFTRYYSTHKSNILRVTK